MRVMSRIKIDSEILENRIGRCVADVVNWKFNRRSTAFISDKFVIKATAQRKLNLREKTITVLVTIGAPNFKERRAIKTRRNKKENIPPLYNHWQSWPDRK